MLFGTNELYIYVDTIRNCYEGMKKSLSSFYFNKALFNPVPVDHLTLICKVSQIKCLLVKHAMLIFNSNQIFIV